MGGMAAIPDSTPAERLLQALEMFEDGVAMKAASLRREYPHEDESSISRRLTSWLHERPGAEFGDAEGRPRAIEADDS